METEERQELPPPPSVVKQEIDETSVENSEQHVERPDNEVSRDAAPSPTTGEEPPNSPWNCIKCIFCQHTLTSGDSPKLLECLHTACTSCVSSKLTEQNQLDGEIVGK
jgi:tripartite motif-containing protein 33